MNKSFVRILFVVMLIVAAVVAFSIRDRLSIEMVEAWVASAGAWSWVLYVISFALVSLTIIPITFMIMAGGVLFGPTIGAVLALMGVALGAASAFLLSRYLLADWVRCQNWSWLNKLLQGVEQEGWRFVALVRLVPVVPFAPSNYGFGLTNIPLGHFLSASIVCMAPLTFGYSWIGYAGKAALNQEGNIIQLALIVFAVASMLILLPQMVKRVKRRGSAVTL